MERGTGLCRMFYWLRPWNVVADRWRAWFAEDSSSREKAGTMKRYLLPFCLLLASCGCLSRQLQHEALDLATTTDDLIYGQVLDNIALAIENPAALPYFDGPVTATAQVQRGYQANYTPTWDLLSVGVFAGSYRLDKQSATVGAAATRQEAWQMAPLYDPDRLYLMHCAYRRMTGNPTTETEEALRQYYAARVPAPDSKPQSGSPAPASSSGAKPPLPVRIPYDTFLAQGWFQVGTAHDVPRNACYVGHHCKTYVWVTPEHMDELAKATLAILDIFTVGGLSPAGGPPRVIYYGISPPPATLR